MTGAQQLIMIIKKENDNLQVTGLIYGKTKNIAHASCNWS